jgi:hypothetical protein
MMQWIENGEVCDDYTTRIWRGEIQYGGFKATNWYSIGGIDHPLFKCYMGILYSNADKFEGLNLHLYGGIQEEWCSWDIDWFISGGVPGYQVMECMKILIETGFNLHLYPDVYYSEIFEHAAFSEKQEDPLSPKWIYQYSNYFAKNGVTSDLSILESHHGLWRKWLPGPHNEKTMKKLSTGFAYKKPIKIF